MFVVKIEKVCIEIGGKEFVIDRESAEKLRDELTGILGSSSAQIVTVPVYINPGIPCDTKLIPPVIHPPYIWTCTAKP